MVNKILSFVVLGVMLMSWSGCSSHRLQEESIPLEVKPITFDSSKSYVYFYRPCTKKNTTRRVTVFEDGEKVGRLVCKDYFIYEITPGKHFFHAQDYLQADHKVKIDAEPGEKYFVKVNLVVSAFDSVNPLSLEEEVGEDVVSSLRQVGTYK